MVSKKDDDVIFVFESRIITPARPDYNSKTVVVADEDSNSSFVFDLKQKKTDVKEMRIFSSTLLEEEETSVVFVPKTAEVVNISSNTAPKTPSISLLDDSDDDDDGAPKRRRKKKSPAKPLVILEKLPDELFITEANVNVESNHTLREFHHHEQELLSFESPVNVENLALHGETSSSRRVQRLSLRKSVTKRQRQRRQQQKPANGRDITVSARETTSVRKRKTYCAFCEAWVMDIKEHKKLHEMKSFTCEVCGKAYNLKTHLSQHFRKNHNDLLT